MTKVGKVSSLYYSPSTGRRAVDEFQLDTKGIVNDKHYNKKINRSVLITSLESYALVQEHGIEISHGALGENLLIDYNPYFMPAGARLKIGTATLEISQNCTLCKSLTAVDTKLPKLLKDDRGIFSKVVAAGTIRVGDDIYILE